MTRHPHSERGSAAVEAVIGVPAFLLFLGLIIYGGRTALAHQGLESAAADAARTASIDRTSSQAQADAQTAATGSLASQHVHCRTIVVATDTTGFNAPLGQPATVSVTINCLLDLSDLTVPGIPGTRWLHATMSSPIDIWRQHS
jgi:Flp pilus assembly protein TadG